MKRFLKSSRTHLLLLAASLFVISSIFGLSAYLNERKTYLATIKTYANKSLGFEVTGTVIKDQLFLPGDTLMEPVEVSVSGDKPVYAFIEFTPSEMITPYNLNTTSWHKISKDSNVYYYGTSSSLVALDSGNSSAQFFEGIILSIDAGASDTFTYEIVGYAVQADHIAPNTTPAQVFDLCKDAPEEADEEP